jgi:hypothetical protein
MQDVYGAKVPKNVAGPGKKFMDMQVTWCGCNFVAQGLTFFISYLIYSKFEEVVALLPSLPAKDRKVMGKFQEARFDHLWQGNLASLICAVFIGIVFLWLARKLMADGNVKCCCIFEGFMGTLNCVGGCAAIVALIVWAGIVAVIPDAKAMCAVLKPGNTNPLPGYTNSVLGFLSITTTTVAPTSTTTTAVGATTTPLISLAACESGADIVHSILKILTLYIGLSACFSCIFGGICCAGAKYANETQDAYDDQEEEYDAQEAFVYQ